jgi:hypothetical protein
MTADDLKNLLSKIEFYDMCSQTTKEINDMLQECFPGVHFDTELLSFAEAIRRGRRAQWIAGYKYGQYEARL